MLTDFLFNSLQKMYKNVGASMESWINKTGCSGSEMILLFDSARGFAEQVRFRLLSLIAGAFFGTKAQWHARKASPFALEVFLTSFHATTGESYSRKLEGIHPDQISQTSGN